MNSRGVVASGIDIYIYIYRIGGQVWLGRRLRRRAEIKPDRLLEGMVIHFPPIFSPPLDAITITPRVGVLSAD